MPRTLSMMSIFSSVAAGCVAVVEAAGFTKASEDCENAAGKQRDRQEDQPQPVSSVHHIPLCRDSHGAYMMHQACQLFLSGIKSMATFLRQVSNAMWSAWRHTVKAHILGSHEDLESSF